MHRRDKNDTLAQQFVKENSEPVLNILLRMVKHYNFFARREALRLLNRLLRDDQLPELSRLFLSSIVVPPQIVVTAEL